MSRIVSRPTNKNVIALVGYQCDSCGTKSQLTLSRNPNKTIGDANFKADDDDTAIEIFVNETLPALHPEWNIGHNTILCPKCRGN